MPIPFAEFLGHTHPSVLAGCFVLIGAAIYFALVLRKVSDRVAQDVNSFEQFLNAARQDIRDRRSGLSTDAWDQLQDRAAILSHGAASWWRRLEEGIELYPGAGGAEAYFLTESASEALPYSTVISSIHPERFRSLPGLLTGFGLTLTFVAILIGLSGVHYDRANTVEPITGVDVLINGLSGKFLSSIIALLFSIAFTLYEQSRMRGLKRAYAKLIGVVDQVLPRLSVTRILLDIRKSSADASVEVAHISADVVTRFADTLNTHVVPQLATSMAQGVAGAFHHQISPTLDKMTGSLDSLQGAIVGLEAQKQESMTGEFERLLRGLEQSMVGALEHMAGGFREALSGSARDEFAHMQATMEGTRAMLGGMNEQFGAMQTAFTAVVSRAEEATLHQVNAGREQTEELGRVMQELLSGISAGASHSMQSVQDKLGEVVEQLVSRVGALSSEMMQVAHGTAQSSRDANSALLEQTEASSKALVARLEVVLESIRDRSLDFERASGQLREAQEFVSGLLKRNGEALQDLAAAGAEVKAYTSDLRSQANSLNGIVTGQSDIAKKLGSAAAEMEQALQHQEGRLQRYENTVRQFETVMGELDKRVASVLQEFGKGFSDYQEGVRRNFDSIVKIANELLPNAAVGLEARVEEFSDQMTNFSDALLEQMKKLERAPNGRAHQ